MELASRVQAVRKRVDLVALVNQDTPIRRAGMNEWRTRNVFHGGDNPTGMAVYYDRTSDTWKFKCFTGQQYHGDVIDYVRYREGIDFLDALRRLEGGMGHWTARQPVTVSPSPVHESSPLSWSLVARYERLLDIPIDPSGRDPLTPRAWWHRQGMDDATISRFRLGFCPQCPMAYDATNPSRRFASMTIPIAFDGQLLSLRHRLIDPLDPKDKYRPHQKGSGLHLFNRDSLHTGTCDDVLIVEGEKKTMVLCRLGVDSMIPVVSATGGVSSWLGRYRQIWSVLLASYDRVYILFDPGSEAIAEQTAWLFGRRGHMVMLPDKIDDYVLSFADPYEGVADVFSALGAACPVRSQSYWQGVLDREARRVSRALAPGGSYARVS